MTEAQIYLATTVTLAIGLVFLIVVVLRQGRDLDDAHAQLGRQRLHCERQHLGDLDAVAEATRPPGPPPLDALVRPVGIFPINPPYRRSTQS